MTLTLASMFTGGGLFDTGAISAGYRHLWGIEYDDAIASVARANGLHTITADVRSVDYSALPRPGHLHASPPCPNFSVAKAGGKETETDIALADAVCRAIETLNPDTFSLENVYAYRKSESFQRITAALSRLGYFYDWSHVNSADYGVPQTRRRLILRASRGLLPPLLPTHDKDGANGLPRWNGWYVAIEDLIPTLPESKFADWQLKRLEQGFKKPMLVEGSTAGQRPPTTLSIDEPSFTITTPVGGRVHRAFLLNRNQSERDDVVREDDRPSYAVTTGDDGRRRAYIVDGKPANYAGDLQVTGSDEPVVTVTSSQEKHPFRAWLSHGRVVKMTPRALARFQSVPDTYTLPEKASLACKVIGNGVPCLLARRVMESLT